MLLKYISNFKNYFRKDYLMLYTSEDMCIQSVVRICKSVIFLINMVLK